MRSGFKQTVIHFLNIWLSYSTKGLSFPHEETSAAHKKVHVFPQTLDGVLLPLSHVL